MGSGKATDVRLFVPLARLMPPRQPLSADDQGYLIRVRRLRVGDAFEVFDGRGGRYAAVLEAGLDAATLGPRQPDTAPVGLSLELWQGMPKSDKLDLIIQKATELGVARLVPLVTQHVVGRLGPERLPKRLERWNRIAAEAARQSGRSDVPEVLAPSGFEGFLERARNGALAALVYEGEAEGSLWTFLSSRAVHAPAGTIVLLAVGPEGGFAPAELDAARRAGIPLLSLGERILRTETAAIVVCALVLAASGGFE